MCTSSIHGHDIIHLIHSAERSTPFTRATLQAEVDRQVGPDARFHTCSVRGMTLPDLLDFLLSRGKILSRDGRLFTDLSKVCGHGEHHHHDHDTNDDHHDGHHHAPDHVEHPR